MVHQSGKQLPAKERSGYTDDELWRIRNYKDHPYDPGWEKGRYCRCHKQIRNAKTRNSNNNITEYVLDVVRIDKKKHYIRSMFQISGVGPCIHPKYSNKPDERDLRFSCYFFAPKQKSKVIQVQKFQALRNYNGGHFKELKEQKYQTLANKIIKHIKKDYQHLPSNEQVKPDGVNPDLWKKMKNALKDELKAKRKTDADKCYTCT